MPAEYSDRSLLLNEIKELKKQIILFDNQYKDLLEDIVHDLAEEGLTKEELLLFYNKMLWSQRK